MKEIHLKLLGVTSYQVNQWGINYEIEDNKILEAKILENQKKPVSIWDSS